MFMDLKDIYIYIYHQSLDFVGLTTVACPEVRNVKKLIYES